MHWSSDNPSIVAFSQCMNAQIATYHNTSLSDCCRSRLRERSNCVTARTRAEGTYARKLINCPAKVLHYIPTYVRSTYTHVRARTLCTYAENCTGMLAVMQLKTINLGETQRIFSLATAAGGKSHIEIVHSVSFANTFVIRIRLEKTRQIIARNNATFEKKV